MNTILTKMVGIFLNVNALEALTISEHMGHHFQYEMVDKEKNN